MALFGDSSNGKLDIQHLENSGIVKIALGGEHSGLLYIDKSVQLVGDNHFGQTNLG